jgi:hypothetical protein
LAELGSQVRRCGLIATISDTTIWRWPNEDAIRPWQHRCWIFPRDPDFEEKAGRDLDLYHRVWKGRRLRSDEFVICADEKTSIQARAHRHPSLKTQPGARLRASTPPSPTLQPLVENTIKHGIAPQPEGGEVRIRAFRHEGRLRVSVADTGLGATEAAFAAGRRRGVGLANLERRLDVHYGGEARLAIDTRPGHGTRILLDLPLREAGVARERSTRAGH